MGQVRMNQRVVFDFDLPTGEYRQASGVNLSACLYRSSLLRHYGVSDEAPGVELAHSLPLECQKQFAFVASRGSIDASRTGCSFQRNDRLCTAPRLLDWRQRLLPETSNGPASERSESS